TDRRRWTGCSLQSRPECRQCVTWAGVRGQLFRWRLRHAELLSRERELASGRFPLQPLCPTEPTLYPKRTDSFRRKNSNVKGDETHGEMPQIRSQLLRRLHHSHVRSALILARPRERFQRGLKASPVASTCVISKTRLSFARIERHSWIRRRISDQHERRKFESCKSLQFQLTFTLVCACGGAVTND